MNDERKTFQYMSDRPKWSAFVVPQFVVHRSSLIISAGSSFIVHRSSFPGSRPSFPVHRSSFIVHHSSLSLVGSGVAGPVASLRPRGSGVESLARARIAATAIDLLLLAIGILAFGTLHWTYTVLFTAVFLLRDWGDCCSPGKRILKLHTVCASGSSPCSLRQSILRNVTLLPPAIFLEVALLLFSENAARLGDTLAGTQVRPLSPPPPAAADATVDRLPADGQSTAAEAAADPSASDLVLTEAEGTLAVDEAPAAGDVAESSTCAGNEQDAVCNPRVSRATLNLKHAAECIGIAGEVTYETLDDAYWRYVDRYSPDAVEKLSDADLLARCTEIAGRPAEPAAHRPRALGCNASREQCLHFLNEWLVVVNKCRDALG